MYKISEYHSFTSEFLTSHCVKITLQCAFEQTRPSAIQERYKYSERTVPFQCHYFDGTVQILLTSKIYESENLKI